MSTSTNTRPTNSTTTAASQMGSNTNPSTSAQAQPEVNVARIAQGSNYPRIRMPTVSNTHIEAWFKSMDHWFNASGIFLDEQRYDTVLAAIDPSVLDQLTDKLLTAPNDRKYAFIKTILISHFADSEQRKLNRLLSEMPLGDKRPSELFHEMRQVAGNVLGEAALKGLWVQRLPESARATVTASSGTAAEFTKIADSIIDALNARPVNQVTASPLNEIAELKAVIAELRTQINSFPQRSRSRSRHSSQRQRTPANSVSNHSQNTNANADGNSDPTLCWYHQKYGPNARNCRSPCRRRNRTRTPTPQVSSENNSSA